MPEGTDHDRHGERRDAAAGRDETLGRAAAIMEAALTEEDGAG
ncbi:MAG: hypothetical protein ACU0AX_04750 [Roseovarius sp.]